ncbi:RNA-binding domain-containing protein [Flagelloscypha sp. PMI_526]|nr:RNA-binding domain-containing protein [Flagelloscypha sp. PMI_526]
MGTPPPLPSLALSPDKVEERIQEITASHAHTAHLTPGRDTRTQLYVGNLPYRVRWQDLKDLFRNAGCNVLRADVSLGPDNRSRGYGTVLLATAEDAGRAIDRFNGFTWQTRVLDVRVDRLPPNGESTGEPTLFQPDEHDYPTSGKNLFVGNACFPLPTLYSLLYSPFFQLPFHIQWQDLKDLFRQAGTIIRADVALGVDGRSRGFGTVVFASEADAEHAVKIFDGYEFNGRKLKPQPPSASGQWMNQVSGTLLKPMSEKSSQLRASPPP